MKLLNRLIEENSIFGKELFGDELDGNEPDTKDEKDIYSSLYDFFMSNQKGKTERQLNIINSDILTLFKNKKDFPNELIYKGNSPLYRYTTFNPNYNYTFDFEKTYEDCKSNKRIIRLAQITDYGTNTKVSSWTTNVFGRYVIEYFNDDRSIILESTKYDNTVFTPEFSEKIKKVENLADEEFEVVKVTNGKPELVNVVYCRHDDIMYSIGFIKFFVKMLNEKLNTDVDYNYLFKGERFLKDNFIDVMDKFYNKK